MMRRLGLVLVLLLAGATARADTPLTLFKTWYGNVNFTGTVVTMRNSATDVCSVYPGTTTVSMALAGIPANATILSAQLYWAGSGNTPDYTVGFESGNVTSTAARSYTSSSIGSGFNYFSGAADVTTQVQARRNGNYQFYGLSANNGSPWCGSSGVVSGFSLMVVYADSSQPFRVLNLYEGFQFFRNTSYTTTLNNLRIPSPLPAGATGRIGHITWEGDATAGQVNEDITFNGTKMVDTLNPSGNQFNSKSNINGNTASYGVDFDAYDVGSPPIQAGQTTATTVYGSGDDMVLLSAQMVATPSVPAVDMSLAITRGGAFQAGVTGAYTLSVYNAGPSTETGPITLVTTLPANLTYVSGTGTRWSCSASGQVVTCKYNGLFTTNTYLPDVTLSVLPTAEGSVTTTVSVSGVDYDYATGNNSASDTTTVAKGAVSYVFTDSLCKPGVKFGTAGQCGLVTPDQRLPAALAVDGYLTSLTGGVPTARSTTVSTTVPLYFAMTCVLPLKNAGVRAAINGTSIPLCADGPTAPVATSTAFSGAINLVFAANVPSTKITFYYADVGRVLLSVRELAGAVSTSPGVIFRPVALRMAVTGNTPASVSSTSAPYRAAGVAFPVKVDAVMANCVLSNIASCVFAPNFGNGDASIALVPTTPSAAGTTDEKAMAAAMGSVPDLVTTGMDTGSGGAFTGTATFNEAGVINLTASVDGGYLGVDDVTDATQKVGRFYPFAFRTTVTPVFPKCADIFAACAVTTPGAAYATQAFDVAVTPLDASGSEIVNFRGVFGDPIVLSAVDSPGGTSVNPPATPAGAKLTAADIPALQATQTNALLHTAASYALPVPFNRELPAGTAWTGPTPIFLRATAVDTPNVLTVTSKQADTTLEAGITILNGRLQLTTVAGSELLRLPVTMKAQFWLPGGANGAWTVNSQDNSATPATIAFASCKRNLLVANACYTGLQISARDAAFAAGQARFFIPAPGAGRTGSAMFNMTGAPAWLPSTLAQALFGAYKSNFIYLREVY
jgi:MSHA biogenesis protein MshQ